MCCTRGALGMKFKFIFVTLFYFLSFNIVSAKSRKNKKPKIKVERCCNWERLFNRAIEDMVELNKGVFGSTDTLKVLTGVLPVYLLARSADEGIHESFYEPGLHKNLAQMPESLQDVINKSVPILGVTLSLVPMFDWFSEDLQETGSLLSKGILSVYALRTITKYSLKTRGALRPWNQNFSNETRALGGFPSGHMAISAYMATLYGLRHGVKWGVPLGVQSALLFMASLNMNRHYASQLIGGAGIGLVYAFASNKILKRRFGDNVSMSLDADSQGRPRISASYAF